MPPPDEFFNPYHFAPLNSTKKERKKAKDFREGSDVMDYGHERFHEGHHCGRIVCRLTTETPMFIGAGRKEGLTVKRGHGIGEKQDYTIVDPFLLAGKHAIPPTSIRGMLSSLVEAVSASAMRVMDEGKPVSYRKPMRGGAITALGVLVKDGDGPLKLRPLALPVMKRDGRRVEFQNKADLWKVAFAKYANMRVYIHDYNHEYQRKIAKDNFSENGEADKFFWMQCAPGDAVSAWLTNTNADSLRISSRNRSRDTTLLTQNLSNPPFHGVQPSPEQTLDCARPWVRGVVRTFGGKDRDLPNQKKHNLFIPYPEDENLRNDLLPISEEALETFNELARERGYAENRNQGKPRKRLPYLPFLADTKQEEDDWIKPEGKDYKVPRLRHGHIVHFDIEDDGNGNPQVSEISFSEIWRGAVKKDNGALASLQDFVGKIDRELLPYTEQRQQITPAERLFGFVDATNEERDGERAHNPPNRAFKGRVRPSLGLCEEDVRILEIADDDLAGTTGNNAAEARERLAGHSRLKILAAPKPPSPALYFKHKKEAQNQQQFPPPITKNKLSLALHAPQGRKVYLHQNPAGEPWRTRVSYGEDKHTKQKNAIKPVDTNNTFWFHLDFDDLSEKEINLLCFALRPSEGFYHKIGMGKPIGLGTVKIDTMGLFLINRTKRYTEDSVFGEDRYHAVETGACTVEDWPERYTREKEALDRAKEGAEAVADRTTDYEGSNLGKACKDAIAAVKAIGEMVKPDAPVTYPLTQHQLDKFATEAAEENLYSWFSNRDKNQGDTKQMRPIQDGKIKPLKAN